MNYIKYINNYNYKDQLKEPVEDLQIEKRIKLFIKYFDMLLFSTKQIIIKKIKDYSDKNINFDKELQYLISTIDESFNWNLMISLINNIKYKNFILFIENLYIYIYVDHSHNIYFI